MERTVFDKYVRDALAHLYDPMYLQVHPLSDMLIGSTTERARSQTLHRLLMETIESLRPPEGTPYGSLAWRKYRSLLLRYVEEMGPRQIAEELGTSGRQARRDHIEAVNAVVSRLWDVFQVRQQQRSTSPSIHPPSVDEPKQGADTLISVELARLSALPPNVAADIATAVESAMTTVVALAENRGIRVSSSVRPGTPRLAIHRVVLRQALVNTLLAAIEYATDGEVEVSATSNSRGVAIVVCAHAAVTADRHHMRLHPVSSDDRMATVAQLLRAYGGSVEVAPGDDGSIQIGLSFPSTTAATVVAIEDNPDMLRLLRRMLLAGGYRMVQTLTATSAIESIQHERPIAVILDVMMPLQDGWEILQALKTHPQTQQVPVIVCSVLKERELALSLGASDFLAKPVTQQELLAALATCRDRLQANAQVR